MARSGAPTLPLMTLHEPHAGRFATRAIHAGQEPDPTTGAIMTPVYLTSTYVQDAPAQPRKGYEYSRTRNPTRTALRGQPRRARGRRPGPVLRLGPGGDQRAARPARARRPRRRRQRPLRRHLPPASRRVFERYGVDFTFVDTTDLDAVEAALRAEHAARLLETPTNPLLHADRHRRASPRLAARAAARCWSSTTPSPRPTCSSRSSSAPTSSLHSTTKYLGGHSDVVGGALVGNDDDAARASCASSRTPSAARPARSTASWCCAAPRRCTCAWSATARTR